MSSSKHKHSRHVAFSVSGGSYPYQMGIACFLQETFDCEDIHWSGASGGSWSALLLAAGVNVRSALKTLLEVAPPCCEGRSIGAYGVYDVGMTNTFNAIFDGVDLSKVLQNNRLAISVTRLAFTRFMTPYLKDEVITSFHSNEDVIKCIIASVLIPFALNGRPFVIYRGWICADAGLTNVAGVRRFFGTSSTVEEIAESMAAADQDAEEGQTIDSAPLPSQSTPSSASTQQPTDPPSPSSFLSSLYPSLKIPSLAKARAATSSYVWKTTSNLTSYFIRDNCVCKYIKRKVLDDGDDLVTLRAYASLTVAAITKFQGEGSRARSNSSHSEASISSSTMQATVVEPYGLVHLGLKASTSLAHEVRHSTIKSIAPIMESVLQRTANVTKQHLPDFIASNLPLEEWASRIASYHQANFTSSSSSSSLTIPYKRDAHSAKNENEGVVIATETENGEAEKEAEGEAEAENILQFSQLKSTQEMSAVDDCVENASNIYSPSDLVASSSSKKEQEMRTDESTVDSECVQLEEGTSPPPDDNSKYSFSTPPSKSNKQESSRTGDDDDGGGYFLFEALVNSLFELASPLPTTDDDCGENSEEINETNDAAPGSGELEAGVLSESCVEKENEIKTACDFRDTKREGLDISMSDGVGSSEGPLPPHSQASHSAASSTFTKSTPRKGHYWRAPRKSQDSIIKKLPCGGKLLELAPWTWRRQPLLHYHLTGDPNQVKMLFDLGYHDAREHMADLLKFFKKCKQDSM